MSDDDHLERCRQLAFEAARLAHAGGGPEPAHFALPKPHERWLISSREPWLQRLEPVTDDATPGASGRAHVPVVGASGAAGWDAEAAREFHECLREFVAERDLPMMLRFDVELVAHVSAVAESRGDMRERVDRVTRLLTRELTAVAGEVTVEIFPGDAWTRRATAG
jgi:hypothetical protein